MSGVLLAAADLDGTLIFSVRGSPGVEGPGVESPGIAGVAEVASPGVVSSDDAQPVEAINGVNSAWVAACAVDDIRQLARSGSLVPVTTRSLGQYERLLLPGPRPRWAVVANGGQLLRDGEPQPWWESRVRAALAAESVPAAEVLDHLRPLGEQNWVRTVREVDGLFTYLVATGRDAVPPDVIDGLVKWGQPRGLEISVQGRKIYLVPRSLTKESAVAAVVELVEAAGYVAAGDSLLDAGLLEQAVAGIRPAHGELHAQNWQRSHVTVTEASGMAAGAEIASWLRAHLGA